MTLWFIRHYRYTRDILLKSYNALHMNDNTTTSGNFLNPKSTFQMDGLLTQEDIYNRFYIMRQCRKCNQWSQHDTRGPRWKCTCGCEDYDHNGQRSIRSWLVTKDLKKASRKKRA